MYDVAVVGAGPAGSTAASFLGRDVLKKKRLSLMQGLRHLLCCPEVRRRIPALDKLHEPRAWMLQYGSQSRPRAYPGAFFVGDAGSFVNPLTGDGIFPAMLTARLAA